jgi:hypothetical protein
LKAIVKESQDSTGVVVQKKKNPIPDGLDTQHAWEEKKNPQNTEEITYTTSDVWLKTGELRHMLHTWTQNVRIVCRPPSTELKPEALRSSNTLIIPTRLHGVITKLIPVQTFPGVTSYLRQIKYCSL